jgi:hypothetical protein
MAGYNILMLTDSILAQSPAIIDDVSGLINGTQLLPLEQDHLTTKQYVDDSIIGLATDAQAQIVVSGGVSTDQIDEMEAEIALLADQADLDALDAAAVHLTGATMTGATIWGEAPLTGDELVNRDYVQSRVTGSVADMLTQQTGDARYLQLNGGPLSGALNVLTPTEDLNPATKLYVDDHFGQNLLLLHKTGGNMTGALTLPSFPTRTLDAVARDYVQQRMDWITDPVWQYMESGAIPIWFAPWTQDGQTLSRLYNRSPSGGQGFNAVAIGAALARAGKFWVPNGAAGYFQMLTPVDLPTYQFMMVVQGHDVMTDGAATLAGAVVDSIQYRMAISPSGNRLSTGIAYQSDLPTPGTVVTTTTPRKTSTSATPPTLYEAFKTPDGGNYGGVLNGESLGATGELGITQFLIQNIGYSGTTIGTGAGFPGQIADIVAVDRTKPDFLDALAAVRAWLAKLHGFTLRATGVAENFSDIGEDNA